MAAGIHRSAAVGFAANPHGYARGRPDYPDEIASWLTGEVGLRAGMTAVDLGAGTGKFTRRLLATGATVIAVEPVAGMRRRLCEDLPGVDAREGTAEALPLEASSADAIVCAQAFHWFATPAAMAELRRVLRPGGNLALVWNIRDDGVAWVAELEALMRRHEGDTPRFPSGQWRAVFPADGFGPLVERRYRHVHRGPPARVVVDRVLSVSFIAALPGDGRERVKAELEALIARTPELAGGGEVSFPYVTFAFHCRRLA